MSTERFPHVLRATRHTEQTVEAAQSAQRAVGPRFIAFPVRLPFHLAVADGSVFALRRSIEPTEPPWVELTVYRVAVSLNDSAVRPYDAGLAVLLGEAEDGLTDGTSIQTWVWGVTSNVIFDGEAASPGAMSDPWFFSTLFERVLAAINRLTTGESILTGHPWSRPIGKEALDPAVAYFDVTDETNPVKLGLMTLHARPYNPVIVTGNVDLNREVADSVGRRLASDASARPHPLAMARELAWRAGAYRLSGDYTAAIITLQTAAESFLRGIHRLALVDSGKFGREVDLAAEVSFKALVETKLPALIESSWSTPNSAPRVYWRDLYEVRNRITHAGRTPNWREIKPAFSAYDELIEFVEAQVAKKFRKLPRTLTAVWEPWAGGRLTLSKAADTRVQEILSEAMRYWLPDDEAGRSTGLSQATTSLTEESTQDQ